MRISLRRVLLVAVASGGLLLGAAAPALALPDADGPDQLSELTDSRTLQEDDDLTQPVTDVLCSLAEIELLGECPDGAEVPDPAPEKPEAAPTKPVGDSKGHGGKGVSDDGGVAPVGGVETGAGGTADDGPGLLLPLSALGGAALTGGAIVGARRLWGNQDS